MPFRNGRAELLMWMPGQPASRGNVPDQQTLSGWNN
jgi:hypothetical protein